MTDPIFESTLLALNTLFPLDRAAATSLPAHSNGPKECTSPTAAAGLQRPRFDIDALKADAGAMYDVLAMIVDFYENGKIEDQIITHNGVRMWLIDEVARELVERHSS